VEGAKGVVFNITGGSDLTLHEVNSAAETIYEVVDPEANIIFGAVVDDRLQGEIRITVIATGFAMSARGEEEIVQTVRSQPPVISRSAPTPLPVRPAPSDNRGGGNLDIPDFLQRRRPNR